MRNYFHLATRILPQVAEVRPSNVFNFEPFESGLKILCIDWTLVLLFFSDKDELDKTKQELEKMVIEKEEELRSIKLYNQQVRRQEILRSLSRDDACQLIIAFSRPPGAKTGLSQ